MSFADLVTADYNFRHRERLGAGEEARPEDMGDWLLSICNVIDKYGVNKPGASAPYRAEPVELEVTTLDELEMSR